MKSDDNRSTPMMQPFSNPVTSHKPYSLNVSLTNVQILHKEVSGHLIAPSALLIEIDNINTVCEIGLFQCKLLGCIQW